MYKLILGWVILQIAVSFFSAMEYSDNCKHFFEAFFSVFLVMSMIFLFITGVVLIIQGLGTVMIGA